MCRIVFLSFFDHKGRARWAQRGWVMWARSWAQQWGTRCCVSTWGFMNIYIVFNNLCARFACAIIIFILACLHPLLHRFLDPPLYCTHMQWVVAQDWEWVKQGVLENYLHVYTRSTKELVTKKTQEMRRNNHRSKPVTVAFTAKVISSLQVIWLDLQ